MSIISNKILDLISPIAQSSNLVVGLVNVFGNHTTTVQIFLETIEGLSPTLDSCARFSKDIAPVLEVSNIIEKKYFLEVSSFGIDRPLLNLKDFERFKNNDCIIKTKFLFNNKKKFNGLLIGIKESNVIIKILDDILEIPIDHIDKANLDIIKNIKINKIKE
jgi:ribosome maturation factor RimP